MLTVTSFDGKIFIKTPIETSPGGNRVELDLSGQSNGVYIINITTSSKTYRTKIIKQ